MNEARPEVIEKLSQLRESHDWLSSFEFTSKYEIEMLDQIWLHLKKVSRVNSKKIGEDPEVFHN